MFPNRDTTGSRLICAIDVTDRNEAFMILDDIAELLAAIKVNYPLILREGIRLITEFRDRYSIPVFADFKVADIPFTNHGIIEAARGAGASAIMVHGIIGESALLNCVKAGGEKTSIIVQTEFTHVGAYLKSFDADAIAAIALKTGCKGVQAPGNRPDRIIKIREIVGRNLTIVCCGVGIQGGSYKKVLESGADYAIVGRAIHDSLNPLEAVHQVLNN